uniref:Ulp1 protease family, C-terminal catalytic domain containing protein n=1 Tax=Solanum tuberosum TaxID=4113 RepID=M1ACL2_SOLTU
MAKQSSKKSKAKKEAHAKTPKKRSRKVAPAISRSALPTVYNDIAVKERNVIPRICNWKVMAEKPKFEMFMKSIFTENNCANIQPTVEEITSLDLRHISHVSPTEPAPSNVNPESDDTSFKEQVMENATEVIHTTHHSHVLIEEVVLNKEADNAIDVAPQSDTKVLSGDEHGVDTLQQNLVKHALNLFLVDTSVSQLPTQLPVKESAHNHDTKTSAPRNRMPSRIVRSSYLTSFGSSDKGKTKVDDDVRQLHPFEGCGILYQMSSGLMDEFSQWIEKGLLKSHANKKPFEDKYRVKSALFGVDHIDFVVTFPLDKNWFYTISQPKKCWTDEHIDVIFYYLRKKSKQRSMDQYRYTTVNYLFKSHINNAHTRYYNSLADDIISTQEHIARGDAVSIHERSIINIINGFSIPTALPWHLVDEVYIPVNCDEEFHWGLAVVVLRKRLIRVYDSNSGPRKKVYSGDIKKLSQILPTYLHDSGFFEKTERTDWAALDTYKDKKTGELLGPQHSFDVEFAQDIMQQESDSLDCEMFVAAFAEFLSDEINMSYDSFGSDYLRKRYATLLWKYGLDKAKAGYVSDNDDPPRLKSVLNSTAENELVNVG